MPFWQHRGGEIMQTINCLIVGVGGQGTLLAGKILGEYAAFNE